LNRLTINGASAAAIVDESLSHMLKLVLLQVTPLIDQDIATIALLLFVVLYLLLFPGGPGTPRRFRNPWQLARVKLES
jgi:hypothetical protein